MKLLLVEDEPTLLSVIKRGFSESNHDVSAAMDGTTALMMIEKHHFDAIILDLMLPGINGLEICRRVRASGNFTPILMLTALASTENVITGLQAGADDYLAKPFKFSELEARIMALLRRSGQEHKQPDTISVGDLEIDMKAKSVRRCGDLIQLTAKELRLLHFLARNAEMVVSREQILDNVWDINFDMNTNVVDVYINYLRKKIDRPYDSNLIHTIKGLGYSLKS